MEKNIQNFLSRNLLILIVSMGYIIISYIYDTSLLRFSVTQDGSIVISLLLLHGVILYFASYSLLAVVKYGMLRATNWVFSQYYSKRISEKLIAASERSYFLLSALASLIISLLIMRSNLDSDWISTSILISSVIFITYTLAAFLRLYLTVKTQRLIDAKNPNGTLIKFFSKFSIMMIWAVGFILLLVALGYDTSRLLTGAGIGGLAIALAAQKSITNIFGAINIVLNKPLVIGNYVRIGTQEGTVTDIGLSYLTVTDPLGHRVMIPNEAILTSNIENFSKRERRRGDFVLGIVYSTSLEKVQEGVSIIKKILNQHVTEGTLTDDMRVTFDMFNSYSLDIKVTYFSLLFSISEFMEQKQSINIEIKREFEHAGIEMALPTQEYIIKEEKKSIK